MTDQLIPKEEFFKALQAARTPSHSSGHPFSNAWKAGELSKDEKIPSQRILSEQLQVSRASLREALLTLETLGLVRTLPARGTFVTGTEVSTDAGQQSWRFDGQFTISDVFQSRLLIETELCRLAAPSATTP